MVRDGRHGRRRDSVGLAAQVGRRQSVLAEHARERPLAGVAHLAAGAHGRATAVADGVEARPRIHLAGRDGAATVGAREGGVDVEVVALRAAHGQTSVSVPGARRDRGKDLATTCATPTRRPARRAKRRFGKQFGWGPERSRADQAHGT